MPDNDYALPLPEARAFVDILARVQPTLIAELGAGFSTVLTTHWIDEQPVTFHSYDHDPAWVTRLAEYGVRPLPEFFESDGRCDLIFIDHGPTMPVRLADIPQAVDRLTPDGTLILDDWRYSYGTKAKVLLQQLGFTPTHVAGTRLCYAQRAASSDL